MTHETTTRRALAAAEAASNAIGELLRFVREGPVPGTSAVFDLDGDPPQCLATALYLVMLIERGGDRANPDVREYIDQCAQLQAALAAFIIDTTGQEPVA